jgi:hypothetical protein
MNDPIIIPTKEELVRYCKANSVMLFSELVAKTRHIVQCRGTREFPDTTIMPPVSGSATTHFNLQKVVTGGMAGGISGKDMDVFVPRSVYEEINKDLHNEGDDIRRLSSWTLPRAFVCLDVSDFSMNPPGQQTLIVNQINQLLRSKSWDLQGIAEEPQLEAQLCTGDGYIYVCCDPRRATFFGARLAYLIDKAVSQKKSPVEFHYRMGIHFGEVYSFWDPGRKGWNYLGEGINGATRILESIGKDIDDVVYVSGTIRDLFLGEPEEDALYSHKSGRTLYEVIRDSMDNKGRRRDKHNEIRRVFQLNHTKIATTPQEWLTENPANAQGDEF